MKRLFTLIFCLFILQALSFGQDKHCGTEFNAAQMEEYRDFLEKNRQRNILRSGALQKVPVNLHIVRTSLGFGGADSAAIYDEIELTNTYIVNANMELVPCGSINYIDDNDNYNFDKANQYTFTAAHSNGNTLNIYFVGGLTSFGNSLCGFSSGTANLDSPYLFVKNSCLDGVTLPHELGHNFRLRHTHDTFFGLERVDGSNCTSTGDLLCSTPADPILSPINVDGSCAYIDMGALDPVGSPYNPDPGNMMSYAPTQCTDQFTQEQYDLMATSLTSDYPSLYCNPLSVEPLAAHRSGFEVYPNPSKGNFKTSFYLESPQDVEIRMINVLGEYVHELSLPNIQGNIEEEFELNPGQKGYFILQIQYAEGVFQKRVLVQ